MAVLFQGLDPGGPAVGGFGNGTRCTLWTGAAPTIANCSSDSQTQSNDPLIVGPTTFPGFALNPATYATGMGAVL